MRDKVINGIINERLIVIVRGLDDKYLLPLAECLYDGGVKFMEVTFTAGGDKADEATAGTLALLCEKTRGKMTIGAGTVLTVGQVDLAFGAGAKFIVSPDVSPEVIARAKDKSLVSIPGAFTPTEIRLAVKSGADFVKLFPANSMGADYVRAIKAPLPDVKFIATAGMTVDNMASYYKAGVAGFGIGAGIIDKEALISGNYIKVAARAKEYVDFIKSL
ncbi:MAG: bifunctional 4-hydroxy-2-oxoglutarate aldolase/2-dehydro-3-deoxy-phosphogluconate aldolase [Clostridia bacterium]|nr:bifunctional 4-hydroxy-2-oxoglutarate aldolase/2-dehydro-3-deoxy-phosphogluconate aldolase [Clostridia bacterium]